MHYEREALIMQVAKAVVKDFYKSGFPKEVQRNKYNLKINERLKSARNRKGLSASGVVKKLAEQGVTIGHSTLQGYEADESSLNHRYPSLPNLMQLAEFYGCSLDYLFGTSDRFRPNTGTRDQDVKDLLESRHAVTYNGIKLNKRQCEFLVTHLDSVVAELF
jgi:transcriptional regulator with XRE-family HTH domain